jgi:hypothetical protein
VTDDEAATVLEILRYKANAGYDDLIERYPMVPAVEVVAPLVAKVCDLLVRADEFRAAPVWACWRHLGEDAAPGWARLLGLREAKQAEAEAKALLAAFVHDVRDEAEGCRRSHVDAGLRTSLRCRPTSSATAGAQPVASCAGCVH